MNQPHSAPRDTADEETGPVARRMPPVVDGAVVEDAADTAAPSSAADTPASPLTRVKTRLKPVLQTAHKAFTEHPAAAGETYWQHLLFTLGMGVRLMFAGFVILIHGILPFALTYTGSKHLKKCNKILSERAKTAQMADESPMPYGDHI